MNRKAVQFVESGLNQKFMDKYRYVKKFAEEVGPKVLTVEHLSAGFLVWLTCIFTAILAFLIEKLYWRISKR